MILKFIFEDELENDVNEEKKSWNTESQCWVNCQRLDSPEWTNDSGDSSNGKHPSHVHTSFMISNKLREKGEWYSSTKWESDWDDSKSNDESDWFNPSWSIVDEDKVSDQSKNRGDEDEIVVRYIFVEMFEGDESDDRENTSSGE